nr:hypothetical protein CFP56_01837 [Quercus suber]
MNVARDLRDARLKDLTTPVLGKEVQKLSSWPVHGLNGFGLNAARDLRNARLKGLTRLVLGKEVQNMKGWMVHGLNVFG